MAKILEPIMIGSMELKNRIVALPTVRNYADQEGYPTYQMTDSYRRVAEGGAGLVNVEATYMRPDGNMFFGMHGIYTDKMLPHLNELVDVMREMGTKTCIQIMHGGRQTNPRVTKLPLVGPSDHHNPYFPGPEGRARAMTKAEVYEILDQFLEAVALAKEAGFDSVMLHGTHGFLINQFMSPFTNKRDDEFGELLAFPIELIQRCKKMCGQDYPILIRMTADEKLQELEMEEKGITLDLAKEFVPKLIEAGLDCIDLSLGINESLLYMLEPIYFRPAESIYSTFAPFKEVSSVPIIGRGRVNDPRLAAKIIEDEYLDLIGLCRQLIADPMTPRKMMEGRYEDVRKCIACNIGCWERTIKQYRIRCSVNYSYGNEYREYYGPPKVDSPKRVLVVGAGPGGLEAARVCAERGHKVLVREKSDMIGGMVKLASSAPSILTRDLWHIIPWLERECKKLGVEFELSREVTLVDIDMGNWDAVILATGSSLSKPEINGREKVALIYLDDYYFSKAPVGERVIVIGGQEGAEAAYSLAKEGKQVTLLSETSGYADAPYIYIARQIMLQGLIERADNISVITNAKIETFTKEGLCIKDSNRDDRVLEADTFLLATGRTPNRDLPNALRQRQGLAIYEIGDCRKPRRIYEAMHEANAVARTIN